MRVGAKFQHHRGHERVAGRDLQILSPARAHAAAGGFIPVVQALDAAVAIGGGDFALRGDIARRIPQRRPRAGGHQQHGAQQDGKQLFQGVVPFRVLQAVRIGAQPGLGKAIARGLRIPGNLRVQRVQRVKLFHAAQALKQGHGNGLPIQILIKI